MFSLQRQSLTLSLLHIRLLLLPSPMAKPSSGTVNPHSRTGVRIVVAGDQGSGKSSLIITAAADNFPVNVPPVLPPTRLPEDLYPDRVPITIIDTSSRYVLFLFVRFSFK